MKALPDCRTAQLGAFTLAQARDVGLTRHQVHYLLQSHRLVALRRGVYIESAAFALMSSLDRFRVEAVAVCLARPGMVVSHHSAALVHGLPLLGAYRAQPTLTVGPTAGINPRRNRCLDIQVATLPASHLDNRGTWAVTTPARTVCDIARRQPSLSALVVADAVLNRGLGTAEDLWRVANSCQGWPGTHRLRSLLRLVDSGSESPYETAARWHLATAGRSVLTQVWAYDDRGPIGCGDLWLPSQWTFLEIDGDVKYGDSAPAGTLLAEKQRQERFERAGFGVVRVSAREADTASVLLSRVEHGAALGRFARLAMGSNVTGYVGPPPPWASRGSMVPVARPPQ